MPTNDERREAAKLCRQAGSRGMPFSAGVMLGILNVGFPWSENCWSALADLIDPDIIPDKPGETGRPLSKQEVDRDWLLEIAGRLESEYPDSRDAAVCVMDDAAKEIREALGA